MLFLASPCRSGGSWALCTPEWAPAALPRSPARTGGSAHRAKGMPPVHRKLVGLSALAVSALPLQAGKTYPDMSLPILHIQMSFSQIECKCSTNHTSVASLLSQHKMTWKKMLRKVSDSFTLLKIQYFWFTWQKTDSHRSERKSKQSAQGWHRARQAQRITLVDSVLPAAALRVPAKELQRQGEGRGKQIRGVRVKIWGRSRWITDSLI